MLCNRLIHDITSLRLVHGISLYILYNATPQNKTPMSGVHGNGAWRVVSQVMTALHLLVGGSLWLSKGPIPCSDEIRENRPPTKRNLSLGLGAI